MRRFWIQIMTKLMFWCSWQLGLNYAVIWPADSSGRVVGIVMATSREAYAVQCAVLTARMIVEETKRTEPYAALAKAEGRQA